LDKKLTSSGLCFGELLGIREICVQNNKKVVLELKKKGENQGLKQFVGVNRRFV